VIQTIEFSEDFILAIPALASAEPAESQTGVRWDENQQRGRTIARVRYYRSYTFVRTNVSCFSGGRAENQKNLSPAAKHPSADSAVA